MRHYLCFRGNGACDSCEGGGGGRRMGCGYVIAGRNAKHASTRTVRSSFNTLCTLCVAVGLVEEQRHHGIEQGALAA